MAEGHQPAAVRRDGYGGLPEGSAFVHHAAICATPADLAREAGDLVRRGLAAGRTVLAVLRDDLAADVRTRLGAEAHRVRFLPHTALYRPDTGPMHEAQRARLEDLTADGSPLTVVGQHDPGAEGSWDDPLGLRCLEGEVRAEIDYAHLPLHQHCLYAAFRHRHLLAVAHRTHPTISDAFGRRTSRHYRTPAALAASRPALSHLDRRADVADVRPDTDPFVHEWLVGAARGAGVADARAAVLAVAAHEAMRTTVRGFAAHGRAVAAARCYLHRVDDGFAVDVDAAALGPLPRGRLPTEPLLAFLWVAAQNSEDVTVRVHALDHRRSRIRILAPVG